MVDRTYDQFRRAVETAVVVTNVRHAAKTRLYDSEDRVCGYALTNAAGRGVSVSFAYDGSYVTNAVYTMPDGGVFSAKLTREAGRRNLVTRREHSFGGRSLYWYSAEYDLLGRPMNATDSVSLVREWLYNRRSELAAATIGADSYGYVYDSIGNRIWSAANAVTNSYTANSLNRYVSAGRDVPVAPQTPFHYDADGNLTGDGRFSYAYDAENRLVSATSAMETNGAIRVLNAYDHRSRRIRKIVPRLHSILAPPSPAGVHDWETLETRTFVWDGSNIVLGRSSPPTARPARSSVSGARTSPARSWARAESRVCWPSRWTTCSTFPATTTTGTSSCMSRRRGASPRSTSTIRMET